MCVVCEGKYTKERLGQMWADAKARGTLRTAAVCQQCDWESVWLEPNDSDREIQRLAWTAHMENMHKGDPGEITFAAQGLDEWSGDDS